MEGGTSMQAKDFHVYGETKSRRAKSNIKFRRVILNAIEALVRVRGRGRVRTIYPTLGTRRQVD